MRNPIPENDPLNYRQAANAIRERCKPARLELIGFRIESKRYSQVRAIMAEMGQSDTQLLIALAKHGIKFNSLTDPELFFTVSSEQMDSFKSHGIFNPTWFQLCGSSEVWATTREECEKAFRALKEEE